MATINCLFHYDFNYRLEIKTQSEIAEITFTDLLRNLRDHPKLKSIDFADSEKYVIEIFDKDFSDYVKLPRDAKIHDFTKLRARAKPKANEKIVKKDSESSKRPLLMYAELNMEEEHAAKILRGSPPLSTRVRSHPTPVQPPQPSRQQLTPKQSSLEHQTKQQHTPKQPSMEQQTRQQQTPKPPEHQTRQQKTPEYQTSKQPLPQRAQLPPRQQLTPRQQPTEYSTRPSPKQQQPILPDYNTLKQQSTPKQQPPPKIKLTEQPSPKPQGIERGSSSQRNGDDSCYLVLAKVVAKYNDEFSSLVMFDDVWDTDSVWSFVYREVSSQLKEIQDVSQTRSLFKSLVDKYISILKDPSMSEQKAEESWPLFSVFHNKLNVKPFFGQIKKLKDKFDAEDGTKGNTEKSDGKSQPLPQRQPQTQTQNQPEPQPQAQAQAQAQAPAQAQTQAQPPKTTPSAITPSAVTSDDFRLLLAVEDRNKDFYDETIPEYSIWKDVADEINLFKPFEPNLVMVYKTRFYELLEEFIRLETSDLLLTEKVQWKLYSSFIKLDVKPFQSKSN